MDFLYDVEQGIFTKGSGGAFEAVIVVLELVFSVTAPDVVVAPPRRAPLGTRGGGMNPDEARTTLEAKLAEIDAEMAEMEKPPTDQGSISFGKRIGEGTSMAIDRMAQVAVHDRMQLTRAEVVRALEKLDEGSYGRCDVCGKEIREGRLEALPWAVLCVEDAGKR